MEDNLFYSSGETARIVGVSQSQIRALCEAKSISASMTPGGQWRIPRDEVERIKTEGLPPMPRPMPDGTAPRRANGGKNCLLGPPTIGLMGTAEKVVATSNLLQQKRLELEVAEVENRLREQREAVAAKKAERDRVELEHWRKGRREEKRRREAAREAEERKRWRDQWIDFGVERAAGAPAAFRLAVHDGVSALLDELSSSLDQQTVQSLVDAAVEEGLRPWRHAQDRRRVIEDSLKRLPSWAGNPAKPTEWKQAVTAIVGQAVDGLGEDAGYQDMMAAASPGVAVLLASCEHLARLTRVVNRLWLSADDERAVWDALRKLPVGSSEDEMERAAKGCLRRRKS